jgi:hypothetical protein
MCMWRHEPISLRRGNASSGVHLRELHPHRVGLRVLELAQVHL